MSESIEAFVTRTLIREISLAPTLAHIHTAAAALQNFRRLIEMERQVLMQRMQQMPETLYEAPRYAEQAANVPQMMSNPSYAPMQERPSQPPMRPRFRPPPPMPPQEREWNTADDMPPLGYGYTGGGGSDPAGPRRGGAGPSMPPNYVGLNPGEEFEEMPWEDVE